jgi:alkylation response protein AidB-like acyl-CoA dehydrogenase
MPDEVEAQRTLIGGALHTDPLKNRAQGIGQGCQESQERRHHRVLAQRTTPARSSATEAQFELDVRSFLDAHAAPQATAETAWGDGSDNVGLFPERTPNDAAADLEAARAWSRTAFDSGFGWITGPIEYGGRGLARSYQHIDDAMLTEYAIPSLAVFGIGLGMVAPTILAHATEAVHHTTLRPLHRGDMVACQLFSEPGAGSDLASVQTRAVRDGDEWIVNAKRCGRPVLTSPTSER